MVEGQDLFRLPVTVAITTRARHSRRNGVGRAGEGEAAVRGRRKTEAGGDRSLGRPDRGDPARPRRERARRSRRCARLCRRRCAPCADWPAISRRRRRPPRRSTRRSAATGSGECGPRPLVSSVAIRVGTRALELIERAYADPDYRVRKAAVLATADLGAGNAVERLRALVERDPNGDVVAAAIAALAGLDPPPTVAFLRGQLDRDSWHDEVRIATLRALGDSGERRRSRHRAKLRRRSLQRGRPSRRAARLARPRPRRSGAASSLAPAHGRDAADARGLRGRDAGRARRR